MRAEREDIIVSMMRKTDAVDTASASTMAATVRTSHHECAACSMRFLTASHKGGGGAF